MRSRDDFIENLKLADTHLLILTEDIKYPLSEDRQRWLHGAKLLTGQLLKEEMQDDIKKVLQQMGQEEIA